MVPAFIMLTFFNGSNLVLNNFFKSINNKNSVRKYSNNNFDKQLYYYLAGLIEGDGHFYVPKSFKSSSGRNTYASIEVVFALKDLPSAEFLKKNYRWKCF